MIQSLNSLFFPQIAKNIGFIKLALLSNNFCNLSNAFFIFSMICGYSAISSNASVNCPEKNFESTSSELSFQISTKYEQTSLSSITIPFTEMKLIPYDLIFLSQLTQIEDSKQLMSGFLNLKVMYLHFLRPIEDILCSS